MNARQRVFADNFLQSGNATQAAIQAGYEKGSAGTTGSRLLKNAGVKQYIGAQMAQLSGERIATASDCLQFLTDVMLGKVKDCFGLDASLSDRLKAAQELLRRHSATETGNDALQRLDMILLQFQQAIEKDDSSEKTA